MTCKREQILSRLYAILKSVPDFKEVERNLDEFPDIARPMAILLDGDEEAVPDFQRSWVKGKAYSIIDMSPIIVVSLGGQPKDIGPDINELMARIITAVLLDEELNGEHGDPEKIGLVTKNGGVYYVATDYRLNHSLAMDCDMQIRFKIRYPLFPSSP